MKIYILGALTIGLVNALFTGFTSMDLLFVMGMIYTGKSILQEGV